MPSVLEISTDPGWACWVSEPTKKIIGNGVCIRKVAKLWGCSYVVIIVRLYFNLLLHIFCLEDAFEPIPDVEYKGVEERMRKEWRKA